MKIDNESYEEMNERLNKLRESIESEERNLRALKAIERLLLKRIEGHSKHVGE